MLFAGEGRARRNRSKPTRQIQSRRLTGRNCTRCNSQRRIRRGWALLARGFCGPRRSPTASMAIGRSVMQQNPIPPFTRASALRKVEFAESVWNTCSPAEVVQLCSPECVWRDRDDSFQGRAAIEYFLKQKWVNESRCEIAKELWAFTETRISVRFVCEWQHAKTNHWYRRHGNEHWEFDACGYMTRRDVSANDVPVLVGNRGIGIQP